MSDMTTIKVPRQLRDRLAEVTASYGDRITLGEGLERLIREHEDAEIIAAYDRFRDEDPEGYAEEQAEMRIWDRAAASDYQRQTASERK